VVKFKGNQMPTKNLVDLKKELLIRVAGKEEKNHTLSWEILKHIGDNTQKLIDTSQINFCRVFPWLRCA
jgi:hypothetical protein